MMSLFVGSLLMIRCGGDTMNRDAKRLAKLHCNNQHLISKMMEGDESAIQESSKIVQEAESLSEEMMEKYGASPEKSRKFTELVMKEVEKCE